MNFSGVTVTREPFPLQAAYRIAYEGRRPSVSGGSE
ncbi:hypothetical protein FHR33_004894 [Nonomuraea dietziae]|uniref:Uncharacterized protein n=1 Tax=Nonomuraea dietziae TaxID=65515 RepID=A0A7W5VCF8_9ACTN|nr:hypothetical protein [Nonomuraea dietziae]